MSKAPRIAKLLVNAEVKPPYVPDHPPDETVRQFCLLDFRVDQMLRLKVTPGFASWYHKVQGANRVLDHARVQKLETDAHNNTFVEYTTDCMGFAYVLGHELNVQGHIDTSRGFTLDENGHPVQDVNGDLIFSTSGPRVIPFNAQHRCAAIARAGIAKGLRVVVGCGLDVRDAIDNGKIRKPEDQLRMAGCKEDSPKIIAIVRTMERLITTKKGKYTQAQLHATARTWDEEIRWMLPRTATAKKPFGSVEINTALLIAYRGVKNQPALVAKLEQAIVDLETGLDLKPNNPMTALRTACIAYDQAQSKCSASDHMHKILNAFAMIIKGQAITIKIDGEGKSTSASLPKTPVGRLYFVSLTTATTTTPSAPIPTSPSSATPTAPN